jgi:hypothetical protein
MRTCHLHGDALRRKEAVMTGHPDPVRPAGARFSWLLLATLSVGCSAAPAALPPLEGTVAALPTPAGPGSNGQFLQTGGDGALYLSWTEPLDDSVMALASTRRGAFRMRFATLRDGQWSEPRTIVQGDDLSINWASFPSLITLPNGSLATHYSAGAEGSRRGGVTLSHDGGTTWTEPKGTRGIFLRLFPWGDDAVGGIWLQSWERDELPPGMAGLDAPYAVRTGVWNGAGELIEDHLLDAMVCSCCQNAAAVADDGPVVLYRGRTFDEIRNIMVSRYVNGAWTQPQPLHDDGWMIPGCPVNGPSLVAQGNRLFAAWFTAPDGVAQVRVAFSEDGGATFGPAFRVDDGDPLGRVDVAFLPDGTGLVSWLERNDVDADIRVRRIDARGNAGAAHIVSAATEQRTSGFPRVVVHGSELYFAWAEPGEPAGLRVARAGVPAMR